MRSTRKQFDLSPTARWENVRRAFAVRSGYHLKDAHVLLCDDILTTGATCSEAARALREAGASRVSVVVVARTLSDA
jgi:predicted amidophosphoribosyltransferase